MTAKIIKHYEIQVYVKGTQVISRGISKSCPVPEENGWLVLTYPDDELREMRVNKMMVEAYDATPVLEE